MDSDTMIVRKADLKKMKEDMLTSHHESASRILFIILGAEGSTPIPEVTLGKKDTSVASSVTSVAVSTSSISCTSAGEVYSDPIQPFVFVNAKGDSVDVNPNLKDDKKFEGLQLIEGFEHKSLNMKMILGWCRSYRSTLITASKTVKKYILTKDDRKCLKNCYEELETRDWKSGEHHEDRKVLFVTAKVSLAIATSRNMPVPISEEKRQKMEEENKKPPSTSRSKRDPAILLAIFQGKFLSEFKVYLESLAFLALVLSGEVVMNHSNRFFEKALIKYHAYYDFFSEYFESNPEHLFDEAEVDFTKNRGKPPKNQEVKFEVKKDAQVREIVAKSTDKSVDDVNEHEG